MVGRNVGGIACAVFLLGAGVCALVLPQPAFVVLLLCAAAALSLAAALRPTRWSLAAVPVALGLVGMAQASTIAPWEASWRESFPFADGWGLLGPLWLILVAVGLWEVSSGPVAKALSTALVLALTVGAWGICSFAVLWEETSSFVDLGQARTLGVTLLVAGLLAAGWVLADYVQLRAARDVVRRPA